MFDEKDIDYLVNHLSTKQIRQELRMAERIVKLHRVFEGSEYEFDLYGEHRLELVEFYKFPWDKYLQFLRESLGWVNHADKKVVK